jgi:hypothetical protein
MKLGDFRYSDLERRVFALLKKKAKTSAELADTLYPEQKNGRPTVICACRSLAYKLSKNKEPFRLKSSKRNGPHPVKFWIEEL